MRQKREDEAAGRPLAVSRTVPAYPASVAEYLAHKRATAPAEDEVKACRTCLDGRRFPGKLDNVGVGGRPYGSPLSW